jgi:uncharacterized membrane protein
MDDVVWILLLALIALGIPLLGLVGFIRSGALKRRVETLEAEMAQLKGAMPGAALPAVPPRTEEAVPPAPAPEPVMAEEVSGPEPEFGPAGAAPLPAEPETLPVAARQSLEERLGTRWAVWLGGLALALGGLFLVRYSIEQGWFGPTTRVMAGALFALALLGVGEWLRRKERSGALPSAALAGMPAAHIPSIVTAAGTVAAFGTVYAAHALYDLIGPMAAFVLLGLIGLGTMAAAALHGPALAGFGLVASFAAPLLVTTAEPSAWPLVPYLAVVTGSAYALARIRLWYWLAVAGAIGAGLWSFLIMALPPQDAGAAMAQIGVQTLLAAWFLIADVYRGEEARAGAPDLLGTLALAGLGALAALATGMTGAAAARIPFAGAIIAIDLLLAWRWAPAGAGLIVAPAMAAGTLWLWPVAAQVAGEGATVLPGPAGSVPLPEALLAFLAFAAVAALATLGAGAARLARGRIDPFAAILVAAGAAVGPIAILTVAWWRVTRFDTSIPFALGAAALAVLLTGITAALRRLDGEGDVPAKVGVEAFAAAAIGALSLGLTMALDRGSLTVALALSALGAAWVNTRATVTTLRYAVGALGVVVLARLIRDPTVVGQLGTTPILNWLLWGYGVPALAFGFAARLLSREREDAVTELCRGLCLAFSGLLVFLQIRHLLTGGDLYAPVVEHLEAGLDVFASLIFAIVLTLWSSARRSLVLRGALYVFGGIGLLTSVGALALASNPLVTDQAVRGGPIFNSLLPAYLLPALAAFALAILSRGRRPDWFVTVAALLGIGLELIWTVAEIRRLFQGPHIGFWHATSDSELYAYSAALLVTGLVLLAVGIWRRSQLLRLVSGLYLLLAVGKAFLVDMSDLEGVWRALSFIGLGIVLVGIGLVYQKVVFGQGGAARPAAPGPDAPTTAG